MTDDSDRDLLEELASLPTLAHPVVSPDKDEIAFYYDITGRNELQVLDLETGDTTQWSDGEVPRNARWFVKWDANGDRVFFHLDNDGNEQNDIHAIDRDGAVQPVVESAGQNVLHDVAPDGDYLFVGSNREGQMNLYRHPIGSGTPTKLTDYERAVWGSTLSPDGERLAFSTNETDDFDNRDVYVSEADGSNPRNLKIGDVGAEAMPIDWGPDGGRLLVADNSEDLTRGGIYDLQAGSVRWLGDLTYEETPVAFTDDGSRVLATRTRDASTMPVVFDVETGEASEFDLREGVAGFGTDGETFLRGDRVLLTHTTPTRRPELIAYDLDTGEREPLIEAEYGPFSPEDFADATYFTFDSDGVPETPAEAVDHPPSETLEIGALLYDSGRRPSPLIVNPHGGPRGRDDKSFDLYTQFLVHHGFSVLKVNYRGSTGRGRDYVERLIDDWGGAEQGDVAAGTEYALETNDWLDPNRVVVFGGSYGGYSAYWQVVQYPTLYEAGIAWIGLTDLEDMYENTMPHFRTELMEKYLGTPEENPELYQERSPVNHVENVSCPLLLVHGVNDRRVPVSQARIFRDALRESGYEEGKDAGFEYHELGKEGHASSDIDQKKRFFRLLEDFLDRRVGTMTEPTVSD